MSHRPIAILAAFAISTGVAQKSQPPGDPQIVIRSTTQEVLLDFIARDKHQKLVTDLRPEDIEILEDGVQQKLRSFRYRDGRVEPAHQDAAVPARAAGGAARYADLSQINVVSLVFEGLGPESRRQATQAAKDFLASESGPDTYTGVFTLNHRLALLQQYTNDLNLLNQAVDRAASGAYQRFAKDMEAIIARLNSIGPDPTQFQALRPGSAEERGPVAPDSGYAQYLRKEREMDELAIAVVSNQAGNLSIDALEQLIHVQAQLPGRKTIIYFSEGLIVPPEQPERYRAMVSAANRANISFYTVDPSGLDTLSKVRLSGLTNQALQHVEHNSGPSVMPTNYQENLRELAEDTGGFSITDTNDPRVPLRRVMEEVRAHYEATYAPTSSNYDGHFRTIEVRTRKPGLKLQSRKGYFALPVLDGESVAPFEMAALAVLDRQPLPRAFDFHAGVLAFRAAAGETECRAVFSVPSRALHFTEEAQAKQFRIHVSFLALVKDEQDQVVRKISRDLLFQAPAEKRADFERGEVTVTLPLRLPPGRYQVEAVADDRDGDAASTRRVSLVVPAAGAETRVALSDLLLARSVQPAGEDRDVTDPLEFSGGKVTPEMNATILKSGGAAEGVYFVLYPGPGASPEVRIAISHNGQIVTSVRPNLPAAEADGSMRVASRIPFGSLDPGVYEIAVVASQSGATVRRTMAIEVE
jgi:VWFA-related protein